MSLGGIAPLITPWGIVDWSSWNPLDPRRPALVSREDWDARRLDSTGPNLVITSGRSPTVRQLRSLGFEAVGRVVLMPSTGRFDHALPADRTLPNGVARHMRPTPACELVAGAAVALGPIADLLAAGVARVAPVTGTVVIGAGTALTPALPPPIDGRVGSVHVHRRRRDGSSTLLAVAFSPRGRRVLVAKFACDRVGTDRLRAETSALRLVAPTARCAGIGAPSLVATDTGRVAMDVVKGRSLASIIERRPEDAVTATLRAADLLSRWRQGRARPLGRAVLAQRFLYPARVISAARPDLGAWCERLLGRATGLVGQDSIVGPQHHDLTAANILIDRRHQIGFVDWESADLDGILGTDDDYLAVDVAARLLKVSHAVAERRLHRGEAGMANRLVGVRGRAATELGWSTEARAVASSQGWLSHAADEVMRGATSGHFLDLITGLASSGR